MRQRDYGRERLRHVIGSVKCLWLKGWRSRLTLMALAVASVGVAWQLVDLTRLAVSRPALLPGILFTLIIGGLLTRWMWVALGAMDRVQKLEQRVAALEAFRTMAILAGETQQHDLEAFSRALERPW